MISRVVLSGLNALPFSMPSVRSGSIHRAVALEPRLALDHARERFEEAYVVRDGGVEDDVGGVEIGGRRRLRRGGEGIERDPLSVVDRLGEIGVAAALQDRSQERVPPDTSATRARCNHSARFPMTASIARRRRVFRTSCSGVSGVMSFPLQRKLQVQAHEYLEVRLSRAVVRDGELRLRERIDGGASGPHDIFGR
jgi:hypothetical protein